MNTKINCESNFNGYCKEFDDYLGDNFCEECSTECKFYKEDKQ